MSLNFSQSFLPGIKILIKQFTTICLTVITLLVISGCATTTQQKKTGFLGSYEQFIDSKQYKFTKIYQEKTFSDTDIAAITTIKLHPFELWIDNSSSENFNPQQLAELSSYFTRTLRAKLKAKNYHLVDTPTADTLTIRGAFSNIQFTAPPLSPTDFIPFRIVLNAGNAAYLNITDKKDIITTVSIEVEFLHGPAQRRVFAMLATKHLEVTVANNGTDNLAAVTTILNKWIDNFVKKISDLRDAG